MSATAIAARALLAELEGRADVGGPVFERDADEVREFGAEVDREVTALHEDALDPARKPPASDPTSVWYAEWSLWIAQWKIFYAESFSTIGGRPLFDTLNLWNEVEQKERELQLFFDRFAELGGKPSGKRPDVGPETPPTKPIGKQDVLGVVDKVLVGAVIVGVAYVVGQALSARKAAA